jgi:putative transposase
MSDYTKNNKAVYLLQYHVIWCPKYRKAILIGEIKTKLEQIIKEVCAEHNMTIKAMEVMPNHVHLFVSADPKMTPYKIVKNIKGRSSNVLRKQFPELMKLPSLWSGSYFISSIGNASEETIQRYIEEQWTKK